MLAYIQKNKNKNKNKNNKVDRFFSEHKGTNLFILFQEFNVTVIAIVIIISGNTVMN